MKLNKEQKRIIILQALNVILFIVAFPLALMLAGKPMTAGLFFLFAGIAVVLFAIVGLGDILGTKK